MSGLGGSIGGGGIPYVDTPNRILVGPGIAGMKTAFNAIQAAIDYLNGLTLAGDPKAPSFLNRYLFQLEPCDYFEKKLDIPHWTSVSGWGPSLTRIVQDGTLGGSSDDWMIRYGIGSLSNLAILTLNSVYYGAGILHKDSDSVYSSKEPYSIVGGETLEIKQGAGGTPFTVTFQAGDTTASAVVARINAAVTGNVKAFEVISGSGYFKICCNTASDPIIITGNGTANTIFGWPSAGIVAPGSSALEDWSFLDNVAVYLLGGTAGFPSYCFWSDDIKSTISRQSKLELFNGQGAGSNAIRYPGSPYDFSNSRFYAETAVNVFEDITPGGNNWLRFYNCRVGDELPLLPNTNDLVFNSIATVTMYASSYNEQRIIYNAAGVVNQATPPFRANYDDSAGVSSTTLLAYNVIKCSADIANGNPGRYRISASFEGQADSQTPPRNLLIRIRNVRTGQVLASDVISATSYASKFFTVEDIIPTGLSPGSTYYNLEFGSSVAGLSVSLRNAHLTIERMG